MTAPKRWEVERDRFGTMFSGPLEVGECVEVVPVAERDALQARVEELEAAIREHGELAQRGPTFMHDQRLWSVLRSDHKEDQ